jgi:hypothetical protein
MQAATYTSISLILVESIWRLYHCNILTILQYVSLDSFSPAIYYSLSYFLSMLTIFLEIKQLLKRYPYLRSIVSIIHGLDGIAALLLGLALLKQSRYLLLISILMITKFFMLHLLARMVTGEVSHSNYNIAFQTTKAFVHHVGSFLFLPLEGHSSLIAITSIWRFISMTGHAGIAYRESLSHHTYDLFIRYTAYARHLTMTVVIAIILISAEIRRGFGKLAR